MIGTFLIGGLLFVASMWLLDCFTAWAVPKPTDRPVTESDFERALRESDERFQRDRMDIIMASLNRRRD